MTTYRILTQLYVLACICLITRGASALSEARVSNQMSGTEVLRVLVNDKQRIFRRGEEIQLFRGDQITILEARSSMGGGLPDAANFIGFRGLRKNKIIEDDTRYKIDTAQLNGKWSKHGRGEDYVILVKSGNKLLESISVSIKNPHLNWLELTINEKPQVLLDKGNLVVSTKDKIKINRLVTNSAALDQEATVKFIEKYSVDGSKQIEINFLNKAFKFASIQIEVVD